MRAILLAIWLLVPVLAAGETLQGEVVGIADGDTLTLLVDRQQVRIRLSEIDAPEQGQDWSSNSRQALSKKVYRENVKVDVKDVDRYGRTVGKVWLGDRDINREMVQEGHAWVYQEYMIDHSLLADETEAKKTKAGLWSIADPVPPWEWRRRDVSASTDKKNGACSIKGNISGSGERIYHVPRQKHYSQTQINTSKGERYFCSEDEARAAGWRRSRE